MTTGQRICDKRKELGLSQEALGEKLGVSRQSIYKWESDTSLPDIDKLVALARLFGVTVGWLLGVEEVPPPPAPPEQPQPDWEERQEQLVEEVLRRYQAAQPRAKRPRWPIVLSGVLSVVLLWNLVAVGDKLDTLEGRYDSLNDSVDRISAETDRSLYHLTTRMEEILKTQNELTADYSTQVLGFDLAGNTVTFSCRVVPKTHIEGMAVCFVADNGQGITQIMGERGPGQEYNGDITCELTDDITLSAVFVTGETRQTQLLEGYADLLYTSLPPYTLRDTGYRSIWHPVSETVYRLNEAYAFFEVSDDLTQYKTDLGLVKVDSVQVGLFHNKKLIHWLEPSKRPNHLEGTDSWGDPWDEALHDGFTYFYSPSLEPIELKPEDSLLFAARVTDEFGRVTMVPSNHRHVLRDGTLLSLIVTDPMSYADPDQYEF